MVARVCYSNMMFVTKATVVMKLLG